jgi:hypothetical protein
MTIRSLFHLLLLGFIFSLNTALFASDLTGRCGQNPFLSLQTGILSLPSIDVAMDESGAIVPYQALLKYDFERQVFLLSDAAEDKQDCELQPTTGIPPDSTMRIANGACCAKVLGSCLSSCKKSGGCTGKSDCSLVLSQAPQTGSTGIDQGGCCATVNGVCLSKCNKESGCTGQGDCALVLTSASQTGTAIPPGGCCATVHGACVTECNNRAGCTGQGDCSVKLSAFPPPADAASVLLPQ